MSFSRSIAAWNNRTTKLLGLALMVVLLLSSLAIRAVAAHPTASTIYVNASSTGPEDGSLAHPYRTITTALENALNGDTILVYPGVYPERLQIGFDSLLHITLKSQAGPAVTIIDGQDLGSVITIYNGNVTIEGFTIQNGGGGFGLASAGYGIVVFPYTDARATIRGNLIKNTHLRGAIGITTATSGAHTETLIEDNVIVNNTGADAYQAGGIYIDLSDSNSGWSIIRNNIIAYNDGFSGGVKILVCCGVTGFHIDLLNNTIVENTGAYGGGVTLNASSAHLANNIIALNTAAIGNDMYVVQSGALATIEYNDIGDGQFAGTNGNISAPPLLVDPAHGNYHLTADSQCINAGTNNGAPTPDYEGDPRPYGAQSDIGADEFVWPPDSSAPVSSAASPPVADPDFTVSWQGTDQGGSGLQDYDIQVKDGAAGTWTNWLTHTHHLQATYSGASGHTYYFQSRATDHAGNSEVYPGGNGDANTFVGPNLNSSIKRVTVPAGDLTAGSILTYTILLQNTALADADAWMTDTLPAYTQYITDSLASSAEPATYDPGLGQAGTILWHGTITAALPVSISFQVEVLSVEPAALPIRNTVLIDDGWGHLYRRLAFVPSHDIFLPLVTKSN